MSKTGPHGQMWLHCASCLGLIQLVQSLELINTSVMVLLEEDDEGLGCMGQAFDYANLVGSCPFNI